MTGGAGAAPSTLVFGETVLDLVREPQRGEQGALATFAAYPGGTGANVAVRMSRLGAPAALMSGVGCDEWGAMLRAWLEAEGVDLRWFVEPPGAVTPVSLVTLGPDGEPTIDMNCEALGVIAEACAGTAETAIDLSGAVFIASNTLIGNEERTLTLTLLEAAARRKLPVCFDVNLRTARWDDLDRAAELCRRVISDATLVKCNRSEALWLTGSDDPGAAAEALLALGAAQVILTLGAEGVAVRGSVDAKIQAPRAEVHSTLGAGDALIATVLARLAESGWEMASLAAAAEEGVAVAARTAEAWGAVEARG